MMMSQKYFWYGMGFILLFETTYLKKNYMEKHSSFNSAFKQLRYGLLKFKLLHTKLSYLVLDPVVENKC